MSSTIRNLKGKVEIVDYVHNLVITTIITQTPSLRVYHNKKSTQLSSNTTGIRN
jgi:hypothetical protein